MITVDVRFRRLQFSRQEQHLAIGAPTRQALRDRFDKALASKPSFTAAMAMSIDESVLERMISKYSEQLTYQPLSEIRFWFEYSRGLFVDRGYPPLYYAKKSRGSLSPNKSAICAVGEGMAGLLAQRLYRCRRLARPNHDYPDIVMEANKTTYLVESKASVNASESSILSTMSDELPRFVSFASTCSQMDVRPVVALLIGTVLVDASRYRSFVSQVEML